MPWKQLDDSPGSRFGCTGAHNQASIATFKLMEPIRLCHAKAKTEGKPEIPNQLIRTALKQS
jgi:hypothetical protein